MSVDVGGRPRTCWRRWTGIEPAGRGSPVPAALKAVEPTRRSDTSAAHPNAVPCRVMKRLLILVAVLGLAAFAVKKVKG